MFAEIRYNSLFDNYTVMLFNSSFDLLERIPGFASWQAANQYRLFLLDKVA